MQTNPDSDQQNAAGSWDAYWRDAGGQAAFSAAGEIHPAVADFWAAVFADAGKNARRIVDLACGNGALLAALQHALGDARATITCVDISEAAIAAIREHHADVVGVVADVSDTGLSEHSFDFVVSQFGIEYAGRDAIDEALRLLAPGGRLALLLHNEQSSIHHNCLAGLTAVQRLAEARFLPLAEEFFTAGFAAVRGADRKNYDDAGTRLNPAVRAVEQIVADLGADVADGVIARLYEDVARIHQRLPNYDPDEVLNWLRMMQTQLDDYVARMQTMTAAALDETAFEALCAKVRDAGCELTRHGPLNSQAEPRPLGWALLATAA